MSERPECAYCGTTEGLHYTIPPGSPIPPEYICEECFTPQDDGPCFDDLPPVRQEPDMSERETDGGPASPIWTPDMPVHGDPGLSKRDWFAGQALSTMKIDATLLTRSMDLDLLPEEHIARVAYSIADAMLAARKEARSNG